MSGEYGSQTFRPSRPARGAWIEILKTSFNAGDVVRRAPHGARGLKYDYSWLGVKELNVAPRTGRVD